MLSTKATPDIVKMGLNGPHGIAVDPFGGYVFMYIYVDILLLVYFFSGMYIGRKWEALKFLVIVCMT